MRLDRHLCTLLPQGVSRSLVQGFIKEHGIRIDGRIIKKTHFFLKGTERLDFSHDVFLRYLESKKLPMEMKRAEIKVLVRGEKYLAIDKPPFVRTEALTLDFFPVHRLDRDTSGVLIVAGDPQTQTFLQKQWKEKTVQKTYLALVKGELTPKNGAIEGGITRGVRDRRKMSVSSSARAKNAYTAYKVIRYIQSCSLLKVQPQTGRTHQIRVHLASIGHPLCGDAKYGDKTWNEQVAAKFGLQRQFLHASSLALKDPDSGKKRIYKSPLPADLEEVMSKMKNKVL